MSSGHLLPAAPKYYSMLLFYNIQFLLGNKDISVGCLQISAAPVKCAVRIAILKKMIALPVQSGGAKIVQPNLMFWLIN